MRWLLLLSLLLSLQGCSVSSIYSKVLFDEDGQAIVSAALWEDEKALRKVLSKGVSIDIQGSSGVTPLMLLTGRDDLDGVKFLLKHGADLNVENDDGKSALFYSIDLPEPTILKYMLQNGASPEAMWKGETLLLTAMYRDHTYEKFAPVILDAGADINQLMSSYGSGTETLLNTMVNLNFFERVRYLVEKGADPTIPNGLGNSPIKKLETDDVTLLSDRGLDRYFALVHWLKAQGYKIKIQPDPRKAAATPES